MSPSELHHLLQSDRRYLYQFIDVREPDEVQASSLPDNEVLYLPLSESKVWQEQVKQGKLLTEKKGLVVLCRSGKRSAKAATFFG
eukprot:gene9351-10323_t